MDSAQYQNCRFHSPDLAANQVDSHTIFCLCSSDHWSRSFEAAMIVGRLTHLDWRPSSGEIGLVQPKLSRRYATKYRAMQADPGDAWGYPELRSHPPSSPSELSYSQIALVAALIENLPSSLSVLQQRSAEQAHNDLYKCYAVIGEPLSDKYRA